MDMSATAHATSVLPQTNLQLYMWARSVGYSDSSLMYFRDVYQLSQQIFGAQFRATGKPFTAHLVGTAAAACLEQPPEWVIGYALCHLPVANGDFGAVKSKDKKLARVEAVIGGKAAELDSIYENLQRNSQVYFERLAAGIWQPSETEKFAIMIWVSNELDDHLDAGSLFSTAKQPVEDSFDMILNLSRHFNWYHLESLALKIQKILNATSWAGVLASGRNSAYSLAELSGSYPIATRVAWKWKKLSRTLGLRRQ